MCINQLITQVRRSTFGAGKLDAEEYTIELFERTAQYSDKNFESIK